MHFFEGGEVFDLVVSGAFNWEECYRYALTVYGKNKVIIYTSLIRVAEQLHEEGVRAFIKDVFDRPPIDLSFPDLIGKIKELVPVSD